MPLFRLSYIMNEIIKIFLAIFSLYRLSGLISSEEGPYLPFLYKDLNQRGVFERIRYKLGAYDYVYEYDEEGRQQVKVATNLGRGISCSLCVGAYLAVPIALFLYFPKKLKNLPLTILIWSGIWGAQTFLENFTSDDAIKGAILDVADTMENKDEN